MSLDQTLDQLEGAIYAAAFVDAFREIFTDMPLEQRTARAKEEAEFVVECFRKGRSAPERG